MKYRPTGVCSKEIEFDLDDQHRIHNVVFTGGCNGNLQGIASLVEGMEADEAIRRLSGIKCGFKSTSCPDQLAHALQAGLANKINKGKKRFRCSRYTPVMRNLFFCLHRNITVHFRKDL